jgi:hypothetical protein
VLIFVLDVPMVSMATHDPVHRIPAVLARVLVAPEVAISMVILADWSHEEIRSFATVVQATLVSACDGCFQHFLFQYIAALLRSECTLR